MSTCRYPATPKPEDFEGDGDLFQKAIRTWAAAYTIAYAEEWPVSDAERRPPDPGEEPKCPPGPYEPQRIDVDKASWSSCERVDDEKTPFYATYVAKGILDGRPIEGTYTCDLVGDENDAKTWGKTTQEISERVLLAKGVGISPWPRVEEARTGMADTTPIKAKQAAIDADYQNQLRAMATAFAEWYHKVYLPWEIERARWVAANDTLRDWMAMRRLEDRRRADRKYRIIAAIVRAVAVGAIGGGIVLAGLMYFR